MNIIVKNMQMPKDCRECRMMEYHERTGKTWCKPADGLLADTYRPIMYDGRPDWCPLVEIPEKHGRLVDADKLMAIFSDRLERVAERYGIDSSEVGILSGAMKLLESQTAIIEAEGAEQ